MLFGQLTLFRHFIDLLDFSTCLVARIMLELNIMCELKELLLLTLFSCGACLGSVSTGLMQATPGDMKSLRSSAERIADMLLSLRL